MSYIRTTAPNSTNKYFRTIKSGGISPCIDVYGDGSTLPNCVGYAWGSFSETMEKASKLQSRNAENFYGNKSADGYERGKTPKLGAIICWQKGPTLSGNDGAGHVAIVVEVESNGTILTANSGYKGTRFWLQRIKPPYNIGTGYTFQGFIYNPAVVEVKPEPAKPITLPTKHKVVKGDTVSKLSSMYYGVSDKEHWNAIKAANNLDSAYTIVLGKEIVIPVYSPEIIVPTPPKPVEPPKPIEPSYIYKVGQKVKIDIKSNGYAGSADGTAYKGKTFKVAQGWARVVLAIHIGKPYPYQIGIANQTTGFFKEEDLKAL